MPLKWLHFKTTLEKVLFCFGGFFLKKIVNVSVLIPALRHTFYLKSSLFGCWTHECLLLRPGQTLYIAVHASTLFPVKSRTIEKYQKAKKKKSHMPFNFVHAVWKPVNNLWIKEDLNLRKQRHFNHTPFVTSWFWIF